jgi:ribose transport system substrate-binding protein
MLVVLCLASALLLVGCQPKQPTTTNAPPVPPTPPRPKVALVMKTMSNPFFIAMEKGARRAADELGVDLDVQTPPEETDIDKQIAIVEDMIAKKVDVICIAPAGSKEIAPVLKQAKDAGLFVINLDNRVDPQAAEQVGLVLDSYVGADNEEGGYMASKYLAEQLGGKGNVAMLEGIPGVDNAEARKRGFLRAMKEYPGITVVASQSAHWKQPEALNVMTDILQAHKDLDGLFCANDMMALGAIEAIAAAGRTGRIRVTSYDNLEAAQKEILGGRLDATIEQHPDLMGEWGVRYAVDLVNGKQIPKEKLVQLDLVTKEVVQKQQTGEQPAGAGS